MPGYLSKGDLPSFDILGGNNVLFIVQQVKLCLSLCTSDIVPNVLAASGTSTACDDRLLEN